MIYLFGVRLFETKASKEEKEAHRISLREQGQILFICLWWHCDLLFIHNVQSVLKDSKKVLN